MIFGYQHVTFAVRSVVMGPLDADTNTDPEGNGVEPALRFVVQGEWHPCESGVLPRFLSTQQSISRRDAPATTTAAVRINVQLAQYIGVGIGIDRIR